MKSSEDCYRAFIQLKADLATYPVESQTEADTRARLIDRMLGEVLDWSGGQISREESAYPGFMDYVLILNRRIAVLEAKRSGDTFKLPADITSGKRFTLNGIIRRVRNLQLHIDQVLDYCFRNGIEYAIVSNGLQYVIFRAVRVDGIHIGQGHVVVFSGFDDIEQRFVDFWGLLSRQSIEGNSLQRAFQDPGSPSFEYKRVADQIHAVREKVTRNRLSSDLEPLIAEYMGEIAEEGSRDKLKHLFVRGRELREVLEAVGQRINMSVSNTVRLTGRVVQPGTVRRLQAVVEKKVQSHVSIPQRGEVILLLGRVGSGKTTFVTHFLQIDLKSVLSKHVLIVIDFRLLERGGSVYNFFYQQLRAALSKNERFSELSEKQLRRVYSAEIRDLSKGPLAVVEKQNKKFYEQKIAEFLIQKYHDADSHYPRVLRFLADKENTRCFIVFDNVDQHDFELQQEIFRFAHSFSGKCHAFSIVTMWEETYLRSKQTGAALAAYQPVAYTLPATSVVDIISRRLEYLVDDLRKGGVAAQLLPNGQHLNDVWDFLGLVRQSVLNERKRARLFLESISMGNLRRAMELFSLFLVSGHTDTGKILQTYRKQHGYLVPLHEFIKSIGLGDYRYYNSELSQVVNLFSISDESRPSHFTKMRLLEYLYYHRNHSTSYGIGFFNTQVIKSEFGKIGTSEADLEESLRILAAYLLVENDRYDRSMVGNAYRITWAGRYYLRYLSDKFTYLDLVCQDTPISDPKVFDTIKELVGSGDLEIRFKRVAAFVNYLLGEEEREYAAILSTSNSIPLRCRLVPTLATRFESDMEYIRSRRKRRPLEKTPYSSKEEPAASPLGSD
jgi:hypothetical protein